MKIKSEFKGVLIGIVGILLFFLINTYQTLPLQMIGINFSDLSTFVKSLYGISINLITMIILFFLFKNQLKRDFRDFLLNNRKYFNENLKYWLLAVLAMMISNIFIIALTNNSLPNNEELVRNSFKLMPVYMFLSAVIYAPFSEELFFRQSIRNIIKNDTIFILVSGLIFGFLHVFGNLLEATDLLYIIPYSIPGIAFAYMLVKTKNIFTPITFHFIHNGILMSIQVMLLLFM